MRICKTSSLRSEVQFNALEMAVQMETQGTTDCVTNYVNMNVHEMDIPYHTLIAMHMEVLAYGSSSLAKPDPSASALRTLVWLRHTIKRY